MNNYFGRDRNFQNKWHIIMDGLMVNNKSMFFTALYQAMMEHPTYIILSDMPCTHKLDILSNMLNFYEEREEFEKCANLFKIQQQLNNNV
jgi:hypothetical protein